MAFKMASQHAVYRGIGPFPLIHKGCIHGPHYQDQGSFPPLWSSSVARVSVAFCSPGWPAYGSSQQSTEGSELRARPPFVQAVIVAQRNDICRPQVRGGGVSLPQGRGRGGDGKRGMDERETQRHVDRQECGLWKYELIFFSVLVEQKAQRRTDCRLAGMPGWCWGNVK